MPTLSSSYRDGKGRRAEHHARIRAAEMARRAEREAAERARRAAECRCGRLCDSGTPCPMRHQ